MAAFSLKGKGALLARRSPFPLKSSNPWHAQGADCVRVKFIIVLRFFKILSLILKFLAAKIVKFQLHYKSALYFAKIPIKF